ncbi:unnamed protein product [Meloidogyne enterolobii]|uniref:Uncharacterized protein n=1 Tax=Meloidogyne enterolobii TaxID=390850 RepID=A0ACB1AU97_MELEN
MCVGGTKHTITQSFLEKMSSSSSSNYLSTQNNSDISSTFSLRSNLSRNVASLEGDNKKFTFQPNYNNIYFTFNFNSTKITTIYRPNFLW